MTCGIITAQFYTFVSINFAQRRQNLRGDAARHQQRFHGVAHAQALRLGVVRDLDGLFNIGLVVDVDMAHAVEVLNHGDARFTQQAFNQALAAARHDDIHEFAHGDEFAHRRTVAGVDHLHRVFGQACRRQAIAHARCDGLIGMQRLGAAAQYRRIAGFQTQRRRIGGDIGP